MMFPWQRFAADPHYADKIALRSSQGEIFTWQAINHQVQQWAIYLHTQGITSESVVAYAAKNSEAVLFLYLAVIQLGAKILGINPAFPKEKRAELCRLYQHNQPHQHSPHKHSSVVHFCYEQADLEQIQQKLTALRNPSLRDLRCDPQRPATLTLTSGSTGLPKAIVHNMQAHLANAKGVCELMHFTADSSWLLSLPLYHVSGQGIVWRWLLTGGELHFPQADFYQSVLQASHVSLVPTQLQRLLAYLADYTQPYRTQHILLGGSHIPTSLTQALVPYGIQSYSGYGMTEMASTVFAKKSDQKAGVGSALSGREYRLVQGEIWLKGAGLALGIWQDQQIHPITNAQGWLQTKDKGIWQDNELVILGRMDNMFISGGENIQPEEIEKSLLQSPDVKQAFVLPVADKEFGQRPVAIIEFVDITTSENELAWQSAVENLQLFLQGRLERFKQPIAYYPFPMENTEGGIKVSRQALALYLSSILNDYDQNR